MKRPYCLIGLSILVMPLMLILTGCGKKTQTPNNANAPRSGYTDVVKLGIKYEPVRTEPKGLLVKDFSTSKVPFPLKKIGVKRGDIIISCNGETDKLGVRLVDALQDLQRQGDPVTLEIYRDGKSMKLVRSEKIPEDDEEDEKKKAKEEAKVETEKTEEMDK